MWLLMMEDASHFAEAIRLEQYAEALRKVARVFGWTCSFVSRCRSRALDGTAFHLQRRLSEIVWNKYPYCCSLCGQPRCMCPVRRGELEELTPEKKKEYKRGVADLLGAARARTERLPGTLDQVTEMFNFVYKGAHFNLSIEAIVLHFMEEVGEVASCIREIRETDGTKSRDRLREDIEEELADILSWTASSVSKLDYILGAGTKFTNRTQGRQTADLRLSDIVWNEFKHPTDGYLWCGKCQNRQCKCSAHRL